MSAEKSVLHSLLEAVRDWQSVAKMKWLYRLGHSPDSWEELEPESLGGPRWLVQAHDNNEDLIRLGMVSEQDLRERQSQRKEAVEKVRNALGILDAEGERGETLLESLDVDSSPLFDFLRHEKHGSATVALAVGAERAIRKAMARLNAGKGTSRAGQAVRTGAGHDPAEGEQAEGASASSDSAEGEQAERAEEIASPSLPPSRKKALSQYQWAVQQNAELDGATDRQVYDWLNEHLDSDEQLRSFATWVRYVREARAAANARKNTPRRGRQTGRSIVRPDEI